MYHRALINARKGITWNTGYKHFGRNIFSPFSDSPSYQFTFPTNVGKAYLSCGCTKSFTPATLCSTAEPSYEHKPVSRTKISLNSLWISDCLAKKKKKKEKHTILNQECVLLGQGCLDGKRLPTLLKRQISDLYNSEDKGTAMVPNVGNHQPDVTASHCTTNSSTTMLK